MRKWIRGIENNFVSSQGFYLDHKETHELELISSLIVAVDDGPVEKVKSVLSPKLTQGDVIWREFFISFGKVQLHT